ncbi:MAG: hypothetical protein K2M88_08775 [Muribaculaceae bacterium]|nr:hypothetical protein [Muribaculaceae bacterium]
MFQDNDNEDYFDAPANAEVKKTPKQPEFKPDDPRYYERDDEWEHIRPAARNWKMWVMLALFGILCGAGIALYLYYFSPYVENSYQYGYVEKIERRGTIFKTFEGVLLPYKSLADTIQPYAGDMRFSTTDDHVAAELLRLQLANIPARVKYKTFKGTLPWRGDSRIIVTEVDTADVSKIYPPMPEHSLIPAPHLQSPNYEEKH